MHPVAHTAGIDMATERGGQANVKPKAARPNVGRSWPRRLRRRPAADRAQRPGVSRNRHAAKASSSIFAKLVNPLAPLGYLRMANLTINHARGVAYVSILTTDADGGADRNCLHCHHSQC